MLILFCKKLNTYNASNVLIIVFAYYFFKRNYLFIFAKIFRIE